MKKLLISMAALAAFVGAAIADEADGTIVEVDASTPSMTLDNGETYVLPQGFDTSLIGPGMRVALAFDEADGRKMVTDMSQVE